MIVWHVDIGRGVTGVDGIQAAVQAYSAAVVGRGWTAQGFASQRQGLRTALAEARALAERARSARPDVVHLHSAYRPAHALLGSLLRRQGVPFVVSPHSGLDPMSRRRDRWRKVVWIALFERRLLATARAVAVLTDLERSHVTALVRRARCTVVPNAIETVPAVHVPRPRDVMARPRAVMLGRFDVFQKGLDRLAVLAGQLPEVDVVVHGLPDHNEPERLDRLRAAAPSNFELAAPVRGEEKVEAYRTADLYVQLSRWEGLSISVLEALAAGVPCVVSQALADTLDPRLQDVVLVLPEDPVGSAQAVRALLADLDRRAEMSALGTALAAELYSERRLADALESAYAPPS